MLKSDKHYTPAFTPAAVTAGLSTETILSINSIVIPITFNYILKQEIPSTLRFLFYTAYQSSSKVQFRIVKNNTLFSNSKLLCCYFSA